jgi:hypothetical protein
MSFTDILVIFFSHSQCILIISKVKMKLMNYYFFNELNVSFFSNSGMAQ